MARIPRIVLVGEPTAYHIMSRTALDGYPIDDVDKEFFVEQATKLSKLFFVEVRLLLYGEPLPSPGPHAAGYDLLG